MRQIFLFILTAIVSIAAALPLSAQNYQSTPDIIYGQRCYIETDGKYYSRGDKKGTGSMEWPYGNNNQVCYYLHIPVGYTKVIAYITPKATCALRLKVTDPETQSLIFDNEVGASGTKQVGLEIMSDFFITEDKWYRFEFSAPSGYKTIASIDKLECYRESTLTITTPNNFMAPSTHLTAGTPNHPNAPTTQSYDWIYQEVMYPSKYERGARYVESIGTNKGYMGIQMTEKGYRNVIFSMWDNGNTDTDPNLPDYLRSGLMDKDPRVTAERFKGEGTGQKTIFEYGQYYRPDTWVQFLYNARPEVVRVTVQGSKGQDSIIVYQNSITTAWYKMADDPDWTFISTIRSAAGPNAHSYLYSFLENYGETGTEYTRAYYRKAYMRCINDGKWYNVNHFNFGHTQNTGARDSRSDYGHGVTEIYPNAFYMEHGALTTRVNDSSQYAGIPLDQSCVDTIDIDAKIERVNLSIHRNDIEQTNTRLKATGEVYDLSKWTILGYSDEEAEAVANNGLASMAIDGDTKTYWQNKWKSGGVMYPHWIALKAPKQVTINQLDLQSAKTSHLYWPKTVVIHTSEDGENWTVASDTMTIEQAAKSSTKFPNSITGQYFKIEFVTAYGAMLYINEMGLSTDIQPQKIMDYAKELLDNANRFDSYRSEDLEPLREAYADGTGNPSNIAEVIDEISQNSTKLKCGTVKQLYHLSAMTMYQLNNYFGYGKLIANDEGMSIGEANTTGALDNYTGKVDVTLLQNNWMIIRHYNSGTTYLYNPSLKKYLDLSQPSFLSDTPASITLNIYSPSGQIQEYRFTITSNKKYLSLDPTSPTNPIKAVSSLDNSCYFTFYSNFYMIPKQDYAKEVVEECDDIAKFSAYKFRAKNMLAVKEGRVGYPLGESRQRLENAYKNGAVNIDERKELYEAVDECECIPFDPTKYCYRLKSNSISGDNNYFQSTSTGKVTVGANTDNDPATIWSMRPRFEGFSLGAQDVVIGRLPNSSYQNYPLATLGQTKDYGTIYATESRPGIFIFSTNQYSGISISTSQNYIGSTSYYGETYSGMNLEIAQDINVCLNSAGMRAINFNFDVIVPEDLSVYVVDHVEDGTAYFLRVYDRLPACTPAVIRGEANAEITLEIAAPSVMPMEENMLKGTYFEKAVDSDKCMVLGTEAGGKFVKATGTLASNTAYLQLKEDEVMPEDGLTLDFSDEPAAVNSVATTSQSGSKQNYNLQGQPVAQPAKGQIYINQGKKVKK